MKLQKCYWLGLALWALGSSAQVGADPDWKEIDAPPPPSFNKNKLIPIEMPRYVSLRFGVDPATLTLTADGIVRYVVVAVNAAGSMNAMYEGIRCTSGEVKTYARYSASGKWSLVPEPQWKQLNDNLPSKHAMALAGQGVCDGASTSASTAAAIVRALNASRQGAGR